MIRLKYLQYVIGTLIVTTALFDFIGFYCLRKWKIAVRFMPLTVDEMYEEQR